MRNIRCKNSPLDTLVPPLISPISPLGWFPLWRQTSFPAICPNFHEYFPTLSKKCRIENSELVWSENTKYGIRISLPAFFSSHFQKSRPSDLGKTTSCSRHKIGVLCKIKDISSLLLLPCSKHLCNIESCLYDCQSQFISPPFPPMSLFNRIYHIKTIAEFSWRVGTL